MTSVKYRSMFESRISDATMEKLPETKATGKPMQKQYLHGLVTWKVMQRNAWKDIANWRIKRRNNYTKSRRHAWMTITLDKKKLDQLENCPQFAHKLF